MSMVKQALFCPGSNPPENSVIPAKAGIHGDTSTSGKILAYSFPVPARITTINYRSPSLF